MSDAEIATAVDETIRNMGAAPGNWAPENSKKENEMAEDEAGLGHNNRDATCRSTFGKSGLQGLR